MAYSVSTSIEVSNVKLNSVRLDYSLICKGPYVDWGILRNILTHKVLAETSKGKLQGGPLSQFR